MVFGWFSRSAKTADVTGRDLKSALTAHLAGELPAAGKGYAELFRDHPQQLSSGFLLGAVRVQLGNLAGVVEMLRGLSAPTGDPVAAIAECLKSAAGDDPDPLIALLLEVGDKLKQYQAPDLSILFYRVAAQIDPERGEALFRLGDTLHDFRNFEGARQALSAALEAEPKHWGACYTYGVLLQDVGCDLEATRYYEAALELREDHAKTHNNLGSALLNIGYLRDAIPHFNRAVELDEGLAQAWMNLGTVLNMQGNYRESLAALDTASALGAPVGSRVKHALIQPAVASGTAEIEEARSRMSAELEALIGEGVTLSDPVREVGTTPFYLAYQGGDDLPLLQRLAAFYQASCPGLGCTVREVPGGARGADGRVRVGLFSNFFFEHAIGRYFGQVVRRLSREHFQVYAISTFAQDDSVSRGIREDADQVIQVPMHLAASREMIAAAGLDLLIYCDIGLEPLSYFLAFARLAPVQIACYGHPESTGIANIDYFLSHELCEPADCAGDYSEKLLLLSREVACAYYERPEPSALQRSRSDFSLDPEAHLYLCPQSLFKIHPDMDRLFAQILESDPAGVLLVFEGKQPHWNELLTERLARSIVDFPTRVRIFPRMPYHDFLEIVRLSDVVLDSLYFSGGTTTLDSFAVGTPVVTLPGRFMRGRQTLACYKLLGIEDAVVDSRDGYVSKAVEIACNPLVRGELSRRILAASPLLYGDLGMVRELETLLLTVGSSPN